MAENKYVYDFFLVCELYIEFRHAQRMILQTRAHGGFLQLSFPGGRKS